VRDKDPTQAILKAGSAIADINGLTGKDYDPKAEGRPFKLIDYTGCIIGTTIWN
jgi:hypothetical protein